MDGVDRPGLAELFAQVALAQQARNAGQGPQMLGSGLSRRKQREEQVDRLVVDRPEIHRMFQAHEHGACGTATP